MSAHNAKSNLVKATDPEPKFHQSAGNTPAFQFKDNRPVSASLGKLQHMANNSSQVNQLVAFQKMANPVPQVPSSTQLQSTKANRSSQHQQPVLKQENTLVFEGSLLPIQLLKKSEITSTLGANGASRDTVWNRKTNRPEYTDGQVLAVWRAAPKDELGRATCPNTDKKITWVEGTARDGIWDMGHKAGHEYNSIWEDLALCRKTWDQFLAAYQNPTNYQVEDRSANRGHQFEG